MSKRTGIGWVLLALAVAGLAVSGVILAIHREMTASGGQYTSFCNINETVNCDVVLASPYAYMFGIPVAVWAILAYGAVAGLACGAMWARRFSTRYRGAQAVFGLAAWNAVFSAYMGGVAFFVVRALCLLCTTLYLINAGMLAAAWVLFASVRAEGRTRGAAAPLLDRRGRWVIAAAAGVAALLMGAAAWEAFARRGGPVKLEDMARTRPDFYKWYTAQPVLGLSVEDGRNSMGDAAAEVTIVEFSDFECGHCARAYRVMKQVLPRYRGAVRVLFRHFPLDAACNTAVHGQMHLNACASALAAECAGGQGKFWELHDQLFENQSRLDQGNLREYARKIGLDMEAFERCMASVETRANVERDLQEGKRLGINSTPTLFINGRAIKGILDPELLEYAIGIERAQRRS